MQSRYPLLKKWTAEEHERLKAMAEAGHRPDEIALELNRSEAAVRVRAWQHGIALRSVMAKRSKRGVLVRGTADVRGDPSDAIEGQVCADDAAARDV